MMLTFDDRFPANARDCRDGALAKDTNQICRTWPIVEILVFGALLVLFNLFPAKVGILVSATDLSSFVPLLAPGFQIHMPWLNMWWSMALLLAVAKLVHGRWTMEMRWADLGLSVLGICVLGRLVFGGPLVGLNPQWVRESSPSLLRFEAQAVPFLNIATKFGLGLALGGVAVGALQKLVPLLSRTRLDWDAEWASWVALGLILGLVLAAPVALVLADRAYLALSLPLGLIVGAYLQRRSRDSKV